MEINAAKINPPKWPITNAPLPNPRSQSASIPPTNITPQSRTNKSKCFVSCCSACLRNANRKGNAESSDFSGEGVAESKEEESGVWLAFGFMRHRQVFGHEVRDQDSTTERRGLPSKTAQSDLPALYPVARGGQCYLYEAVLAGQKDVARLLLERGADPKVKNNDGQTPADLAESRGCISVLKYIG